MDFVFVFPSSTGCFFACNDIVFVQNALVKRNWPSIVREAEKGPGCLPDRWGGGGGGGTHFGFTQSIMCHLGVGRIVNSLVLIWPGDWKILVCRKPHRKPAGINVWAESSQSSQVPASWRPSLTCAHCPVQSDDDAVSQGKGESLLESLGRSLQPELMKVGTKDGWMLDK